jgi:acetyltransferase-like isoleucine patch superfamily enzyme
LRFWYYRPQFKSCGKNVIIEEGVFFESPEQMSIGNNVWIDKNTILLAGAFNSKDRLYSEKGSKELQWGELVLHDNVHVAPFFCINRPMVDYVWVLM